MKKQSVMGRKSVAFGSKIGKIQPKHDDKLDEFDIPREEISQLKKMFNRYDQYKINAIEWYEVDDIYRDMGIEISGRFRVFIQKELHRRNVKAANLQDVVSIYHGLKIILQEEQEEFNQQDTINSFVAMGGQYDKSGSVSTKTIIGIIRDDFQLDFDIEGYLEKQGLADLDDLAYEDFQKLFENEDAKEILTTYSRDVMQGKKQDQNLSNKDQEEDFRVDYQDFEQWDKQQNQGQLFQNLDQQVIQEQVN